MTDELIKYLLEQCKGWLLPEEMRALNRFNFPPENMEETKELALRNRKLQLSYGFRDEKTNKLVALGELKLKEHIAERLSKINNGELINNCPKCGGLTRTPKAKQCRYCGYDWHNI